jgi:hypothetical protein
MLARSCPAPETSHRSGSFDRDSPNWGVKLTGYSWTRKAHYRIGFAKGKRGHHACAVWRTRTLRRGEGGARGRLGRVESVFHHGAILAAMVCAQP